MTKKPPTIKGIEKRFDYKFRRFFNTIIHMSSDYRTALGPMGHIKDFYRRQIEEILKGLEMEEMVIHTPSMSPETVREREEYNQAVKKLNAKIKEIKKD